MATMTALDDVADALYGVDPDLFVDARTKAVVALKEAGEKGLAKEVGALRRPTRSAWLVNLLSRSAADDLEALVGLSDRLAQATASVDVAALRQAGVERTALIAKLTARAVELGRIAGYDGGEATRAEVVTTLQAALADPEVLASVLRGRVEKAQVYAGFGFALSPLVPGPEQAEPAALTPTEATRPTPTPHVALLHAQAEVKRLEAELAEATRRSGAAEEAESEAYAVLDRASQEVADLRAEVAVAEAKELSAREEATTRSADLHDARTTVQQVSSALDRAVRALADLGE